MNGLTRDIFAVVSYFSLLIKLLENKANIQKKETDILKQFTNMINHMQMRKSNIFLRLTRRTDSQREF